MGKGNETKQTPNLCEGTWKPELFMSYIEKTYSLVNLVFKHSPAILSFSFNRHPPPSPFQIQKLCEFLINYKCII